MNQFLEKVKLNSVVYSNKVVVSVIKENFIFTSIVKIKENLSSPTGMETLQ